MSHVEIRWDGPKVKTQITSAAETGLRQAAEWLRTESSGLAPIDEGHLRRSATVKPEGPGKMSVGFYMPYAARQHEELSYRHPKGGQAKYLEQPMTNGRRIMLALIATALRRQT